MNHKSNTENKNLDDQITQSRQEIKSDRLDMSFGEIMNLYENDELKIKPDFQRAFRWDADRQSRFIESILLGIPFPPIFVVENEENIWELIDGLQRISTVFSFFGILKDDSKNNLKLSPGSIVDKLEGYDINTIPMKYKLMIKRAVCRIEVIRIDSQFTMTYELFKRLNTGGESLSEQEIRNAIYRGFDNTFNEYINKLASNIDFKEIMQIRDDLIEKMYYEELVLRYFTLRKWGADFKTNIQDHMDSFMLQMAKNPSDFDYSKEKEIFLAILDILKNLGSEIFKLGRLNFSTSVFDAIMIGFAENIDKIKDMKKDTIIEKVNKLKKDSNFNKFTGSASSSKQRIKGRIELAKEYLK